MWVIDFSRVNSWWPTLTVKNNPGHAIHHRLDNNMDLDGTPKRLSRGRFVLSSHVGSVDLRVTIALFGRWLRTRREA